MRAQVLLPVWVVSLMLLVFAVLIGLNRGWPLINLLFSLSPVALVWMVYQVIRNDPYRGRELEEEEEWGYADR